MGRMRTNKLVLFLLAIMLILSACSTTSKTVEKEENGVIESQNVKKAQRVIATSITYPDFLYVLGVTPVASENFLSEFPSYLNDRFSSVTKLGEGLHFEAILAAEPDIIIAPKWRDEKDYDQLSKIAPTFLLPDRDDWRDELRDMGDVLGKSEEAEKAIQEYEHHMKRAKEKLHNVVGDETFIYMRIFPKEIYVMGQTSSRGKVIHGELGLIPSESTPKTEEATAISFEALPDINPDHIILQIDGGVTEKKQAEKLYEDLSNSPIWKDLKAVQNDHVYLVGDKEWMNFGFSSIATMYAVDEIVKVIEKKN
jgi:iron complex transport system substrate-binding protein